MSDQTCPPEGCDAGCEGTVPLVDWLEAEVSSDEVALCRPCVLPLLNVWYVETLEEDGHPQLAQELRNLAEDSGITPVTLAARLDQLKDQVPASVRDRLAELDCAVQVNATNIPLEE